MSATALQIFQVLIVKMLPLYAVMGLGFIYGRSHNKAAEQLSFLLIYFIAPVVVATRIADLEFSGVYLLLPIITFLGCSAVGLTFLFVGKRVLHDNTANIFAYATGCANTGYFGVPVALIVFPPQLLGVYMIGVLGFSLFEASLGYYLVARGNFTVRDSVRKFLRIPLLYAAALGIVASVAGMHVPAFAADIARDFRGCYVILGAFMIGIGLSRLKHVVFEPKLLALVFSFKFLVWPLLAIALIAIDRTFTHLYDENIYKMFVLFAVMPLPANAISFAVQLNIQVERASALVFLSTVFALFYIPLVMALWV